MEKRKRRDATTIKKISQFNKQIVNLSQMVQTDSIKKAIEKLEELKKGMEK